MCRLAFAGEKESSPMSSNIYASLPDSRYYVTDPKFYRVPVDELLSKVLSV